MRKLYWVQAIALKKNCHIIKKLISHFRLRVLHSFSREVTYGCFRVRFIFLLKVLFFSNKVFDKENVEKYFEVNKISIKSFTAYIYMYFNTGLNFENFWCSNNALGCPNLSDFHVHAFPSDQKRVRGKSVWTATCRCKQNWALKLFN